MRWLDGIVDSIDMSLHKLQDSHLENPMDRAHSAWGCKESDETERLTLSLVT